MIGRASIVTAFALVCAGAGYQVAAWRFEAARAEALERALNAERNAAAAGAEIGRREIERLRLERERAALAAELEGLAYADTSNDCTFSADRVRRLNLR